MNILKKYGKNVYKDTTSMDDICERQVEAEKEKEQ